ncbi:hypothetical protein D3C75_1116510 [compost metagenome]
MQGQELGRYDLVFHGGGVLGRPVIEVADRAGRLDPQVAQHPRAVEVELDLGVRRAVQLDDAGLGDHGGDARGVAQFEDQGL